jgi:hypothetical protein
MVGLTITFPQIVMHYKGKVVEPSKIEIKMPEMPGLGGGLGLPPLGSPPPGDGGTAAPAKPATPPANDLSQPPKFN